MSGIYAITHAEAWRRYVGQAVDLKRRKRDHFKALRAGNHGNRYLQNAFDKYGQAAFSFAVLELCDVERLVEREQAWMDASACLYNLAPVAGSTRGVKYSTEARAKISAATRGR